LRPDPLLIGQVQYVTALGLYHVLMFGVVVPFLALRGRQKLAKLDVPVNRLRHFQSTSVILTLFGALSLLTAAGHGLSLFHVDGGRLLQGLPAGILVYAAAVVLMRPRWRKAVAERKRVVELFTPQTPAERNWWLVVSLLAGVSEEITWRGVQSTLVASLAGSPGLGVLICAVMFGAAHLTQGWKSAGIIVLFGLGFQLLVWAGGSLILPMLVHTAYDVTAGLTYTKLKRQAAR
jgi:membrane protease YdiL (CAAX protease family)